MPPCAESRCPFEPLGEPGVSNLHTSSQAGGGLPDRCTTRDRQEFCAEAGSCYGESRTRCTGRHPNGTSSGRERFRRATRMGGQPSSRSLACRTRPGRVDRIVRRSAALSWPPFGGTSRRDAARIIRSFHSPAPPDPRARRRDGRSRRPSALLAVRLRSAAGSSGYLLPLVRSVVGRHRALVVAVERNRRRAAE